MGIKNVTVRMPDDLHAQLVALAEREKRSLNGQILSVLEKAVESAKVTPPDKKETAGE